MTIIFNYSPDDVLSSVVSGYQVVKDGLSYHVHEIRELTIRHPQAPDHAVVHKTDVVRVATVNPVDRNYSIIASFHGAQVSLESIKWE